MIESVSTSKAPAAIGPYSQAVKAGNLIFVSGQIPVNPETGKIEEGIERQARCALDNLKSIIEAAGSHLNQVVKTTVYLVNINDFSLVNSIYEQYFGGPYPARACIEVSRLPKDVMIEIDAIAVCC